MQQSDQQTFWRINVLG